MPDRGQPSYNRSVTTSRTASRPLLALRPAALVDGSNSRPLLGPTVLVDGRRILAVERSRCEVPEDTTVVDLPGCTLVPGLIDTHVHLAFDGGADPIAALAGRDDDAALAAMAEAAAQQLRAGVTTVRDLGDRGYLALRLREGAGAGAELVTIVAAGPPLTTPGGHCHFLGGTAAGEAAVRAAVAEHAERGVDVIKVMASGGFLTPGSSVELPQYEPAELRTIVDEAHRHGLPVTAHAHSTAAIATVVDAGVDGIEHCSFLAANGVDAPQHLVERIAQHRIVVGTTLGLLPGSAPPPAVARHLDAMFAALARLHQAGAAMVAGTDAGIGPPKPHGVLPHAARQLADLGLTRDQVLRALTVEAARVCGLGDRKGRVAPGYDADLLAVEGDPLDDLGALQRVAGVWKHGRAVSGVSQGNIVPWPQNAVSGSETTTTDGSATCPGTDD